MNTSRALRAAVAAPVVAAAALLLSGCPTTRWLNPSTTWDAEGREHNAPAIMVWAERPDPGREWPGGIVGLYMIEGYLRNWPYTAPAPHEPGGEYLVVMTLHHHATADAEMMAAAVSECAKYDAERQVPAPFLLTRGGDLGSHVYLCVTADLAAALEQPDERERTQGYLHDAGFRFSPAGRAPGT